jgi:hypothetical protein
MAGWQSKVGEGSINVAFGQFHSDKCPSDKFLIQTVFIQTNVNRIQALRLGQLSIEL